MKNLALAIIGSLIMAIPAIGQEKKLSPAQSVENTVGEVNVMIEYSSPSMRGRTIYGDLVPWGKIWRAGANEATTIEFSTDVKINGKSLPAGKYAFFVIPQEKDEWVLIFNKVHKQWGAYKYDAAEDALKVMAKPSEIDPVESLTYRISDNGEVHLDWADKRIGFSIK